MMYTNASIMKENSSTWVMHFFAKLLILGKHEGVDCVAPLSISLVTFLLSLIPTKSFAKP